MTFIKWDGKFYTKKVTLQIGIMTPYFLENEFVTSILCISESLPSNVYRYRNIYILLCTIHANVSISGNNEYWNDQYIQIRNSNRLQENFNVQCRTKKGSDNWIRLFSFLIDFWDKVIKRRIYIASGYSLQYHLTRTLRWTVNCNKNDAKFYDNLD